MNDLFKKLNTLIRANLNDAKPELPRREARPIDFDRQVDALRKRINDALAHEEKLKGTVISLRDEADSLDRAANAALARGDDDQARALLEKLRATEARLNRTERDLQEHEVAVEELIMQVNKLDAAVSDAKAEQNIRPRPDFTREPEANRVPIPSETGDPYEKAQADSVRAENLAQMIKEAQDRARERIAHMDEQLKARGLGTPAPKPTQEAAPKPSEATPPSSNAAPKAEPQPKPEKKSDDDLQRRIDRLSKR